MRSNGELLPPGFFGLTTLSVFGKAVQNAVDDVRDRRWLALRAPVRIGIVPSFETRMFWWFPVADGIVSHCYRRHTEGQQQQLWCIRYRRKQFRISVSSAV